MACSTTGWRVTLSLWSLMVNAVLVTAGGCRWGHCANQQSALNRLIWWFKMAETARTMVGVLAYNPVPGSELITDLRLRCRRGAKLRLRASVIHNAFLPR